MNHSRRIAKLNHMLEIELGGASARLAWISTDSVDLEHPAEVYEQAEDPQNGMPRAMPVYDTVCYCGRNVRIHRPDCRLSGMVQRGKMQKLFPKHPHCWIICTQQPVSEWQANQLSLAGRNARFLWVPLAVDGPMGSYYIIIPDEPTETQTRLVIRTMREFRSNSTKFWAEQIRKNSEQSEKKDYDRAYAIARESMGISLNPGEKNSISFPAREKDKQHIGAIQ